MTVMPKTHKLNVTMELRTLRYFQAVAEELSFSRAARKLSIAQPALSRAVKDLEVELGGELFKRNRRMVKLTAAGVVLLREANALLGQSEESLRKVQRTLRGQEGELRLGFIGPPTQSFLPKVVRLYRKRYPHVSIVLEERTPERVWEMVSKDRLDVGLTRPVSAGDKIGLKTKLIQKEALCAVVPSDHPFARKTKLRWADLRLGPLILLARREGVGLYEAALQGCREAGFSPKIAHTPSIVGTVLTYAEAGMGVGVVPETVAVVNPGEDLHFIPLSPACYVELVLVWSAASDNPAVAGFREVVAEVMR
jgi:DNA-binding transcriptional LysR family regulator